MKTLICSIIFAATFTLSSATFAQTNNRSVTTKTQEEKTQLFIQSLNTGKVDVTIQKPEHENVRIQLLDARGTQLASKMITKRNAISRTRFDLNALPDGVYKIVVGEGSDRQIKDVILDTHQSDSYRTVTNG